VLADKAYDSNDLRDQTVFILHDVDIYKHRNRIERFPPAQRWLFRQKSWSRMQRTIGLVGVGRPIVFIADPPQKTLCRQKLEFSGFRSIVHRPKNGRRRFHPRLVGAASERRSCRYPAPWGNADEMCSPLAD
jgi:hypothetical protein